MLGAAGGCWVGWLLGRVGVLGEGGVRRLFEHGTGSPLYGAGSGRCSNLVTVTGTAPTSHCLCFLLPPARCRLQGGIERKAASRNLFIKLLSLKESRQLLSAEAAGEVDLEKIFGVTPRDVLTLRSGYSAEEEGGGSGGAGGQSVDQE